MKFYCETCRSFDPYDEDNRGGKGVCTKTGKVVWGDDPTHEEEEENCFHQY